MRRSRAQLSARRWGAIQRLVNDSRGGVALLFALGLPVVAGAAAFGVETGYVYFDQYRLQNTADNAAYAAALDARAGGTQQTMSAAALEAALANGFVNGVDTITLNTPPTSGPNQRAGFVEVLLTRNEPRYFTKIFTEQPQLVHGRAVATSVNDANACILALDKGASRAVEFSGSSTVTLGGCNVMANSIAADAVYSQGATSVNVPCIMAAGDVSINAGVHLTACAAPLTQLQPVSDPFRNLPEPAVAGACMNENAAVLQPGRYCGGLSLKGTTALAPGVYIIDGGMLKSNGNANVSGSGVTFFLANSASVSFNGNSVLNLSAPISGAYSGMLFFGARSNSPSADVLINGTSGSTLTGAIYFPAQPIAYQGNMQGTNGCTQVVAKTITWTGNATFSTDCTAVGMSNLRVGGGVRLSE